MMAEASTPSYLITFCSTGWPENRDVLPRAGARVLRARRLQQQLRHLAAVDGQTAHFKFR